MNNYIFLPKGLLDQLSKKCRDELEAVAARTPITVKTDNQYYNYTTGDRYPSRQIGLNVYTTYPGATIREVDGVSEIDREIDNLRKTANDYKSLKQSLETIKKNLGSV